MKKQGPDQRRSSATASAVLSAVLFGLSAPFSKVLVARIPSVELAGLLYVGAFLGISLCSSLMHLIRHGTEARSLSRGDFPWLAGSILAGGVFAPIALMIGLTMVTGFTASLFLNLEGVSTALLASLVFREHVGKRIGLAVLCMAAGSFLLTWDFSAGNLQPLGPLLLLMAALGWGLDNNLTRKISDKDPVRIAQVKGLLAGATSLSIAAILGNSFRLDLPVLLAILVGAVSYGASLVFFVRALEGLGAARTAAFYGVGPFVGALASLVMLREWSGWTMLPTFFLMALGAWLLLTERHAHFHTHEAIVHTHQHTHDDLHHTHHHDEPVSGPHSHEHIHEELRHSHPHVPDPMHRHGHAGDDDEDESSGS